MLAAAASLGADWAQWGGHDDRNMVSKEVGLAPGAHWPRPRGSERG
jgi:hypothetical protein